MVRPSATVDLKGNDAHLNRILANGEKRVKSYARNVGNALKSVAKAAAIAVPALAIGIGIKSLNLAREQIQAEKKLEAVVRATGQAAGFTSDELKKMAADLQKVTNFGDEVTISALAVLATFKEIKGDVFVEAIKSAQDMSSVLGTDLQGSVLMLGKALNDPIKGMTALTRSGVSFTTEQKELVRTLQESGDLMGAQKIILAELASEFGGAAEEMVDPITQAFNDMGDAAENLGVQITPLFVKLAKFASLTFEGFNLEPGATLGVGAAPVNPMFAQRGEDFAREHEGRFADTTRELLDWEAKLTESDKERIKASRELTEVTRDAADAAAAARFESATQRLAFLNATGEYAKSADELAAWVRAQEPIDEAAEAARRLAEQADAAAESLAKGDKARTQELERRKLNASQTENVEDLIASLGDQIGAFFVPTGQEALFGSQGADQDAIDTARGMIDELAGLELARSLETPFEQMERQLAEFDRLFDAGAIDQETLGRAKAQATVQADVPDATQAAADQGFQARFEGITDTFRRISAAAASRAPEDRAVKAAERSATATEATAGKVENVDKHVQGMTGVLVEIRDKPPAPGILG
jgi:hypothetical protein